MEQEPILNAHNKQEFSPMHTGGTNTPTTLYSSKVPKCRFMIDSAILLVLVVVVICFTTGLDVELFEKSLFDRRSIFAFSIVLVEG